MSVLTWSPSSTSGVDPLPVRQMNSRGGGLQKAGPTELTVVSVNSGTSPEGCMHCFYITWCAGSALRSLLCDAPPAVHNLATANLLQ